MNQTQGISHLDYDFFLAILKESSGLDLGKGKEYLLESRLLPVAREAGVASIGALADVLRKNKDARLLKRVNDAMTTNESLFFRDGAPFEYLKKTLLPELAKRNHASRSLRIWSAACSTGQEPLSIAICLQEAGVDWTSWKIEILCSDYAAHALARAKAAVYTDFEVRRGLTEEHLKKYFVRGTDLQWTAKPMLTRSFVYRELNLMAPLPDVGTFDVIFLRNVLIYFELSTKKDIVNKLARKLTPQGHFLVGSTETLLGITDEFVRADRTQPSIYIRKD